MPRRKAFTLVELLVVIGIVILLVSILLPVVGALLGSRDRAVALGLVRSLKLSLDAYQVDQGYYPDPPYDTPPGELERDFDEEGNLLAQLNERYNLALDNQFMDENVFVDIWGNPLQYVKGDFANRIPKKNLTADSLPQDTNKPKDATIPAAESDWNRDNRGGYPYVWSYGPLGPDGDPDGEEWVYLSDD